MQPTHNCRIATRAWALARGGAIVLDPVEELAGEMNESADYIWYVTRGKRPDFFAATVTRHTRTGHCTGEHSF